MLILSHNVIGGLVYRHIISYHIPFSPIGKILFKAGNILPDISYKLSKVEHNLEGSSKNYNNFIEKSQDKSYSSGERMISMGAACHYLSDYFCKYHVKEPYKNHSISRHLFYEFKLHLSFLIILPFINKFIKQILVEETNIDRKDFSILLTSLQNEYLSQKSSQKTDIIFALKATLFSTELLMNEYLAQPPAQLIFDATEKSYVRNDII